MYKNLAVVQQKIYSYLTRFKNVAFYTNIFFAHYDKGPPPSCLPQGPHHDRSTPGHGTADAEEDRRTHGDDQSIQYRQRDGGDATRHIGDDTAAATEDW